ncbi:MAG TPA: hypothetical protein VGD62_13830 [Acidobacteriaceae bacterium]
MDLLDRYLHAVKFWLPKDQEQDITAELSEEIRSQLEEREAALGRPLHEAEVAAFLKQMGRPVVVANRYLPQQSLIGPALFPVYKLVLKIVGLFYLVPWTLILLGTMLTPGYRAAHHGQWLLSAALSFGYSVCFVVFVVTGIVTLVFAVLERAQARSPFLGKWDPAKLPPVRVRNRVPRLSSIIDLVANVVFCLWWLDPRSPSIPGISAIEFSMTPVWRVFFWGFLLVALAKIALDVANLRQPYWTRGKVFARLLANGSSSVLFCYLCRAQVFAGIHLAHVPPEKAPAIAQAANGWLGVLFPYAFAAGVAIAGLDLYRLYRVGERATPLAQRAVASR